MSSAAEKMRRHATKFYRSSAPERVLERYFRKSEVMGGRELVRHISHVCAWIALAQPLDNAAKRTIDDGLSPVVLLGRMLGLRGRAALDDRARAALAAVLSSCKIILGSDSRDPKHDWQKLRDLIPKKLTKCPKQGSEASDIWMFKRVRRLNHRICKWESLDFDERQAYASNLVVRFAEMSMSDEMSSVQLRGLLCEVAAAVSPPRGKSLQNTPVAPMDSASLERLRASALLQKEMRRIMLQGIVLWRGHLHLDDDQIEPILARMRHFIKRFEKRHGDLHLARAGKQWAKLKTALGNSSKSAVFHRPPQLSPTANPPRTSTTKGGRYTPNERIRSFPFVKQRSDCAVKLFCETCQRSITSDWFLEHATGKTYLLVPTSGHMIGDRKVCRKYVPKDVAIQTRQDKASNLRKLSGRTVRGGVSI